jgi:hypothetical protein
MTYDEVIHWGPGPMVPEHPVEVWEPVRGVTICDGLPFVEVLRYDESRYRTDERGRVWRRVLHGDVA